MKPMRKLFPLAALLCVLTVEAGDNRWTSSGPLDNGSGYRTVRALALSGDTFFAGTDSGLVYALTAVPPGVVTGIATSVDYAGGVLNGTVNARDADSTVVFEYGPTTAYGSTAAAAPSPVTGTTDTAVSAAVSGLVCGVTYHYRVRATSSIGTASGDDASFTTVCQGQSISFGAAPTLLIGGSASLSAAASSGLTVSFSSLTTAVCNVTGNTVQGLSAGICRVAADQAGDERYAAAPQTTQTVIVNRLSQTIGFGTIPTLVVGGMGTLSATASSGLAVSFSSLTPAVCAVSGGTVQGVTAGTCSVAGQQAGSAIFNPAPQATLNITVGKGEQSISFAAAPSLAVAGTASLSATASSGLAVSFSSLTPAVCSVNGSSVQGLVTGSCTVAADQAGDADYNAAPRTTQEIGVGKGDQSISFAAAPTLAVATSASLSATASSGLAVSYSSLTPAVCAVNGDSVQGLAAGTCTVAAEQAGNADYNPAPRATQQIEVGKGEQSISLGAAPALTVAATASLSATASSGLTVSFSSLTPAVCAVHGDSVQGLAAGTCTVAAEQAGNADYNPAPRATLEIGVGKGEQSISFVVAPELAVGGTASLSASASSGLAVSYSSLTPAVCAVSGDSVQGLTVGGCMLAADQPGNADYHPAPRVTRELTVSEAPVTRVSGDVGTGPITASVRGDGDRCSFTDYRFQAALPATPPVGVSFPHGVFDFTLSNCPGTAILTLVYPAELPPGSDYWKYGPTTPGGAAEWYVMPGAQVSGDTVTFSLTDGELGDDDWSANGEIVDAGGPGQALRAGARPVPVLSGWAMILLTLLLTLSGVAVVARRAGE